MTSGGGVRRRKSEPREHDDVDEFDEFDDHAGVTTGDRTVDASFPGRDQAIRTTATDATAAHPRQPTELPQRPRFPVPDKKRYSDDYIDHSRDDSRADTAPTARLSLDARPANAPGQAPDSTSPSDGATPPTRSQTPPLNPNKASTRSRGRSLRSSMFHRNLVRKSSDGDSWVEMTGVPSSSHDSVPDVLDDGKKAVRPAVTVSPVAADFPSGGSAFLPDKGVQGGGAASALPNYQQWFQRQAGRHLPIKRVGDAYEWSRRFVLRIKDIPPSKDGRHIPLDPWRKAALIDERTKKPYVENWIRSTRYSAWNFFPRQFFAQFSKLANFYFLLISILQMIPGLSTTGMYTTIVPLLFFISFSMAKEGYDDLRRHRLDKAENNREASLLRANEAFANSSDNDDGDSGQSQMEEAYGPIHWAPTKWQQLHVGDVIKLVRDEACPADLVLLNCTGANGVAYVETMALDGETNLKPKQAPQILVKEYASVQDITNKRADFVVEDPNLDLYNFEGKVKLNDEVAPVTNNEIIYRGSILRNTPEAVGMVIYSGEECKIRMNANKHPRIKAPALQSIVNKVVVVLVVFVISLALFNTVAYQVWARLVERNSWYLTDAKVDFGHNLTSFIIMFNTLIPLSLYVSMEIIKLAQMFSLNDIDMYDEASDTPCEPRTSTINEELGQISHIFSDKTGTLTENVMRFRKLSVAGTAWIHEADLEGEPGDHPMHQKRRPRRARGKGKKPLRHAVETSRSNNQSTEYEVGSDGEQIGVAPRPSLTRWKSSARPNKAQPELPTSDMIRYMQRRPQTAFAKKARLFLLSLAICHTCLPERVVGSNETNFQASSPDELALVRAAEEMGFLAYDRDVSTLTLKLFPNGRENEPQFESYEILDVIQFSSKRKRMSVVVRFPDGRVCVMCKGADSVIIERLRFATLANQKMTEIEQHARERNSVEARHALTRRSSQLERTGSIGSFPRTSNTLPRANAARPSIGRLQPIMDEVDSWITERERDSDGVPSNGPDAYSPRPSAQLNRGSMVSERNSSESTTDWEDYELVEESLAADDYAVMERCLQHINDFATEGLRTLLYGYRFIDEDEYREWKKLYHEASTSLVERQAMMDKVGEMIEQQLELTGATAIEDKLQNGVPETIDKLRRANIKMWMLTGDKRETAINIGQSCRLIKDYSSVTILDHEAGDVEQKIAAAIVDINRGGVAHSVIVIDGQTLAMIDADESLHSLFLDLAILADSTICCRASPSQKAGLVNGIRRRVKKSVTLAIGDGANDIAMIQEAHVGIGITGKEGFQAARSSDYSIAQFRFLTKLLLVHGRWNYVRTCKYVVATFWKEMLFYLTQALYQRWNGYTGTSLYESWSLSMFNTLFTSLPVIFIGIFEKDLAPATLIAAPELYNKGQRNGGFNFKVYIGWMFMAASEAMIVYFMMYSIYGLTDFTRDQSLFALGDMTFSACVIFISVKLQILEQHNRSIMAIVAMFISVGGWWLWNLMLAILYKSNFKYHVKGGIFTRFGRNPTWWLCLVVIVSACVLLEIGIRALKAAFLPTDVETFQALEKNPDIRKRFEKASEVFLQGSRQSGDDKTSLQLDREAKEQQKRRERQVQELLARPRMTDQGRKTGAHVDTTIEMEEQPVLVQDGPGRPSTDIQVMLARRSGGPWRNSFS